MISRTKIRESFKFLEFDAQGEHLAEALSNHYHPVERVRTSYHYIYFLDFFGPRSERVPDSHDAATILIEQQYFSESYQNDYHSQDVLSYQQHDNYCKRVHFFGKSHLDFRHPEDIFSYTEIADLSEEEEEERGKLASFWHSYLGYVVIRPTPIGEIGATLVKPFPAARSEGGERIYKGTANYDINIFGVQLINFRSLPYQKQDTLTNACASAALWSASHKLTDIFKTRRVSPGEITLMAGRKMDKPKRLLPNNGLDAIQMRNVINGLGLEAEIYNTGSASWLRNIVNAYAHCGFPIVLGLDFKAEDEGDLHAVTVTGFCDEGSDNIYHELFPRDKKSKVAASPEDPDKQDKQEDEGGLVIRQSLISKFYVHDDGIGPFARIEITDADIISAWWDDDNIRDTSIEKRTRVKFDSVLVPVKKMMRIRYDVIYKNTSLFQILYCANLTKKKGDDQYISWNIYLKRSNSYKSEIRRYSKAGPPINHWHLHESMPEYIWVAEMYIKDEKILDIVYDSTAIDINDCARNIIYWNKKVMKNFEMMVTDGHPLSKANLDSLFDYTSRGNDEWLHNVKQWVKIIAKSQNEVKISAFPYN